jgi:hypothetical protein
MRIANALILFLLLTSLNLSAQIKIPDAGDGWKQKVETAIQLIKETDTAAYRVLIENCKEIDYIIGSYSTTQPPHTIVITVNDLKINSINNIACILVHESCHLYIFNNCVEIEDPNREEYLCYMKEYDFICKLPYVEDWLFQNAINKLLYYKSKAGE